MTGVRLLFHRPEDQHPERSWAYRVLRRVIPSTPRLDGRHFLTVEDGRRLATPLFLALVLIELSDVVFALDSVPAILGVTLDPFIVFTSNIFAILGLRSLYFVLARLVGRFEYLQHRPGGWSSSSSGRRCSSRWVHVPSPLSLAVVVGVARRTAVAASAWKDLPGGEPARLRPRLRPSRGASAARRAAAPPRGCRAPGTWS